MERTKFYPKFGFWDLFVASYTHKDILLKNEVTGRVSGIFQVVMYQLKTLIKTFQTISIKM